MPQQEVDPWLAGGVGILILASLATWGYLIARRARYGHILAYEPRQPAPWGSWATLWAILMTGLAILIVATQGGDPGAGPDAAPPDEFADVFKMIEQLVSMIVFQTVVTGSFFAVVILVSGANQRDLGLPLYADEAARDVLIGIVACLAAYVPVWAVQMVIVQFRGDPEQISEHPLIEMVIRQPNLVVMLLAFVAAVIVAPITEEITYRLLLQGWLEKWEDRRLGWRSAGRTEPFIDGQPLIETMPPQSLDPLMTSRTVEEFDPTVLLTPVLETTAADRASVEESAAQLAPPGRGLLGLPYGSVPILISSVLFSLAHVGAGADPFPLFPLALILGYVYQRTHRIIPCIVTHFMFNFTSMTALWRMINAGME